MHAVCFFVKKILIRYKNHYSFKMLKRNVMYCENDTIQGIWLKFVLLATLVFLIGGHVVCSHNSILSFKTTRYLSSDIVFHNTQISSHHYLRSQADHTRLHIPKTHRSTGDKAFFVIGPRLWNMIPITTRENLKISTQYYNLFRKTKEKQKQNHLFFETYRRAYFSPQNLVLATLFKFAIQICKNVSTLFFELRTWQPLYRNHSGVGLTHYYVI